MIVTYTDEEGRFGAIAAADIRAVIETSDLSKARGVHAIIIFRTPISFSDGRTLVSASSMDTAEDLSERWRRALAEARGGAVEEETTA